jgi:hypothetical protein
LLYRISIFQSSLLILSKDSAFANCTKVQFFPRIKDASYCFLLKNCDFLVFFGGFRTFSVVLGVQLWWLPGAVQTQKAARCGSFSGQLIKWEIFNFLLKYKQAAPASEMRQAPLVAFFGESELKTLNGFVLISRRHCGAFTALKRRRDF